jgi:hypothetical protein
MNRSTLFFRIQRVLAAVSVLVALLIVAQPAPVAAVNATGGNVTNDSIAGYRIHIFTNSATASNFVVMTGGEVEVLVVAGGGGGGGTFGGGGGAGGLVYTASYSVSMGSYPLTVGAGGAGGSRIRGSQGTNSSMGSTLVAYGGGGGGYYSEGTGLPGGSGGGGGATEGASMLGGAATNGQGYVGGTGTITGYCAAGGGGASAVGENGIANTRGGNGGKGQQYSISGTSIYYAGGGGGAGYYSSCTGSGIGGLGGGGVGMSSQNGTGTSGNNNTGGGGGGGGYPAGTGGNGGSGIVIVRYAYSTNLFVWALSASPVGVTNATLNGILSVYGGDANTTVAFCWGDNDANTNSGTSAWTHVESMGTTFGKGQSFSTNLVGLISGSSYVFRCFASNTAGTAWSSPQTFTTVYSSFGRSRFLLH